MPGSIDQDKFDRISPKDAFTLLGNETRINIIRMLGETSENSLSFSVLRERVNVADSGQFNYHLGKLIDSFVVQNEEDEYELTYAGTEVIGAIFSGRYTQRSVLQTFELDSTCTICDSVLLAEYEYERVTINCPGCNEQLSTFGFPPGAFDKRTPSELTCAFDTWTRSVLSAALSGFCLTCAGQMRGSIINGSEHLDSIEVGTKHICERCTTSTVNSIGFCLLNHPAVVAFHYNHNINLTKTMFWNIPWIRDEQNEILSQEPWRVKSVVEIDGDRLECIVDTDLSVSIL